MNPLLALNHPADATVLVCTTGFLLIYWELNRPGLIVPGATGLLFVLWSIATLSHMQPTLIGVLCLTLAAAVLLCTLRWCLPRLLALIAAVGLSFGCRLLFRGPEELRVHLPTAIATGTLLGLGTSLLTALARRARVNKGLD